MSIVFSLAAFYFPHFDKCYESLSRFAQPLFHEPSNTRKIRARIPCLSSKMGNVASAAAGGVQQPPKPPPASQSGMNLPPAPPMTAPAPEVEKKPETVKESANRNPGSYEELYKRCKGEA